MAGVSVKSKPRQPQWLLVLIFLLFAVAIGAAGYYFYLGQERGQKQEILGRLSAIVDLKVKIIDNWRKERLGDAALLVETPFIADHTRRFFDNPKDAAVKKEILEWLASLQSHYQYNAIYLLDGEGRVRLSVPERAEPPRPLAKEMALQAVRERKGRLSELYRNPAGDVRLSLFVPILAEEGRDFVSVGVLLLRADPHQFLYPVIDSWPAPSSTTETALVCREGDDVVYLNAAGRGRRTPLVSRFPLSRRDLPEVMAVQGKQGIVETTDDRGVDVLAAMRPIPESPWFIVAKVDRNEIYLPIRKNALATAAVVGLMILGAGLGVGLIWHRQRLHFEKTLHSERETAGLYARRLIEASLDPLVTISPEGKITDVNQATELATGLLRNQLIGRDFSDFFTEPEKAREGYRRVFSGGFVKDYPLAIRHVSGRITDVLYNAVVYENEAGEVQGVFAAARDVTEVRLMEKEQLRLAAAVEQAGESILLTDPLGVVDYVNPAFEKANGAGRRDILKVGYPETLSPAKGQLNPGENLREVIRRGDTWTGQATRKDRNGRAVELDVTLSPVKDKSGSLMSYLAIERDVTRERLLQEHARRAQKMEALGTLAGGIAHDLNNILSPIMINTEIALWDTPEGSPMTQTLRTILQASTRGKELVKQILAFTAQTEQEPKPLNLGPIIEESLNLIRATIPRTIDIRQDLGKDAGRVLADPTQIHQVVVNLCTNSSYAMRDRGGVLDVRLARVESDASMFERHPRLKPGTYVRLTVSDTGHGMSPDVLERIFDPFFTTKKPGEGTGMGLAVVHGIVESCKGAITVYSQPDEGSTFNVFLPAIQAGEEQGPAAEALPTGTERILLVDDEEILIKSIRPVLERLGYKVIARNDGGEALKVFRARPEAFDLVITDQAMPHVSGLDLAEEIWRIRPGLPIILCTGFSAAANAGRAKAAGVREFLMKPFAALDLARAIRRALDRNR